MSEEESVKKLISPEEPGLMSIEVAITIISVCIGWAI